MDTQDRKVLHFLSQGWESYGDDSHAFYYFRTISEETEIDIEQVRLSCRRLREKGYAEYQKGLWSADGVPAGAGYGITRKGLDFLEGMET